MRNAPAVWSVLFGLLAAAVLPAAIVYADRSEAVQLLWAGVAVPVALLLGLAALAIGRRGQRRAELTVLGRSGRATARLGRLLGLVGILLAGTGAVAVAVYAILTYRGGS